MTNNSESKGFMERLTEFILGESEFNEGELIHTLLDPSSPGWAEFLSEREEKEVRLSCVYERDFAHGTAGHGEYMLIAKMANMLNSYAFILLTLHLFARREDDRNNTCLVKKVQAWDLIDNLIREEAVTKCWPGEGRCTSHSFGKDENGRCLVAVAKSLLAGDDG